MGIPAALDWASVLTGVGDLLGNGLVLAAVSAALALRFAPRIMGAIFRATRSK
jgi:hypothetical protein